MQQFCNIAPAAFRGEADHRIANNLAMLAGLIRLQAGAVVRGKLPLTRVEVAKLLAELGTKVDTVANLHRALAITGTGRIKIAGYLRELCETIAALSPAARTSVLTACDQDMEGVQALPLGFIVAEMITNALKHAHPTGIPVLLNVTCKEVGHTICIEVSDDGVGFPEGFDPASDGGLGLRLMRSLAQQIAAELSFTSGPLGTTCRLVIRPQLAIDASFLNERALLPPRETPGSHQHSGS